ncbi:MAG: hypothetical protein Rubg2KO_40490 [Rubricoccaceae bacterium]
MRAPIRSLFVALFAIACLASGAEAQETNGAVIAYTWSGQASPVGSYTPDPVYTFNPEGAVTVRRTGVGVYDVRFENLAPAFSSRTTSSEGEAGGAGHVQVTAYNTPGAYCKTNGWSIVGSALAVTVNCFDAGGDPLNARFTALFVEPGINAGELGFVWANNATSSSYAPEGTRAYNSAGGDVRIDHPSTGFYTVRFTKMADYVSATNPLGGVHVTGYGFDNTKCQTTGWNTSGDEVRVFVLCREPGGRLKDGRFTLMTAWPGTEVGPYAYAWADQSAASSSYTPASAYNEGRSVTVSPLGTGHYRVRFSGLAAAVSGGTVQVSARDSQTTCQAESWAPDGSVLRVDVRCTDESGSPANAQFVASAFEGAAPSPEPGRVLADFSRFPGGTLLFNQFNDQGLRFVSGALVVACASDEATCTRSRSARNVIAPVELASEFRRRHMSIQFGAAQTEVSVSLNSAVLDGLEREVVVRAEASDGSTVDEAVGVIRGNPGWTTRLTVTAADIGAIIITSKRAGADEDDNQFILDDLAYTDTTPYEPDDMPPTVKLWNTSGGGTVWPGKVYTESPIDFLLIARDNRGLAEVTSQIVRVADGRFLQPRTTMCGTEASGFCGSVFSRTVAVGVTAPGEYEITVTATDFAGFEAAQTVLVSYEPTPVPTAFVHKVEFNQSVAPRLYDRNVRLTEDVFIIPGKDLLVRYYLHSEGEPRESFTATMRVEVQKEDGSVLNRALSPNADTTIVDLIPLPADGGTARRDTLVTMRADLSRTLNYVIPGDWLHDATFTEIVLWDGVRELSRAQVRDIGENESTLGLQLVYVNDEQYLNYGRSRFNEEVRPYLEHAMPYGNVQILSERGFDFFGSVLFDFSPCRHLVFAVSLYGDDFGSAGLPGDTRLWWSKMILADDEDLYGDSCVGIANRPGRNVMVRYNGGSAAHEVGHNTGREHASNAHGESGGGGFQPWPYYHGAIGDPDTGFGIIIDPVADASPTAPGAWDLTLIDPCPTTDLDQRFAPAGCGVMDVDSLHTFVPHELMSYGVGRSLDDVSIPDTRGRWPSYDTYRVMHSRGEVRPASIAPLLASSGDVGIAPLGATASPVPVLIATAILDVDGTAYVLPLTGRSASADELARQESGEVLVELLGDEGVLASTTVASSELADDDGEVAFIQAMLPAVENVRGVRFSIQGVMVAEQDATAHAPQVRVLSPLQGAQFEDGTVPIQWEGSDSDEDDLTYIVEYSPNGGETWETLRVVLPGSPTTFEAPVTGLATGIRGLIRVTASDGINVSRVLSQPFFSVGPEPPATPNDAPDADAGADQTVIVGQEVTLDGTNSSDPNDDPLTFAWTLDGPGNPALSNADAASSMFCTAEVGEYTATLVVNDGTEDSAPDATTITTVSIDDGLVALIADINALVDEGSLDRRLARALTGRLTKARRQLARGRSASAMLRTVRTRIGLFERTGTLTPAQAEALRASLDAISGSIDSPCSAVERIESATPQIELEAEVVLGLAAPRPNPTSGRTVLAYGIEEEGAVRLAVYDALGREVAVLVNGTVRAGNHAAAFEAREMPAGVYVVRLIVDGVSASTRRLTVVR